MMEIIMSALLYLSRLGLITAKYFAGTFCLLAFMFPLFVDNDAPPTLEIILTCTSDAPSLEVATSPQIPATS
jgi:hypothetical protein